MVYCTASHAQATGASCSVGAMLLLARRKRPSGGLGGKSASKGCSKLVQVAGQGVGDSQARKLFCVLPIALAYCVGCSSSCSQTLHSMLVGPEKPQQRREWLHVARHARGQQAPLAAPLAAAAAAGTAAATASWRPAGATPHSVPLFHPPGPPAAAAAASCTGS